MLFEDRRLFCMKARQLIFCLEEIRAKFLVPTANHHPGELCGLAAMSVAIQYRGSIPTGDHRAAPSVDTHHPANQAAPDMSRF
jgi:hypothetical protein